MKKRQKTVAGLNKKAGERQAIFRKEGQKMNGKKRKINKIYKIQNKVPCCFIQIQHI